MRFKRVAASILQSSMSLGPLSSAHHSSHPDDQLSQGGDTLTYNGEAQNQVQNRLVVVFI